VSPRPASNARKGYGAGQAEDYRSAMRRSSGPRTQARFRDRVAAFREQAAEVRAHDLAADRNSYSMGMRLPTGASERHRRDTKLSHAEQRELASLLRPFLAKTICAPFTRCFGCLARPAWTPI
jgi:hypothetical protein